MEDLRILAQLIIAFGILNVWLLRFNKSTPYRGGKATNMKEEFAIYGLPTWFMWFVGGIKVLLALTIILGLWIPQLISPAAIGMSALMLGAVIMHLKVHDTLKKTLPASVMMFLSLFVALS